MVEAATSGPATSGPATASSLASAITTNVPTGPQRAQSRVSALQSQRASEASLTPQAIFNRNLAGPGVIGNVATRPAFRVGQLDTELLDEELLDLLKQQLWGALKYFRPSLKENFEPEFMAILRAALFKLTIWDHDATYGAALQNLKYVDARGGMKGADRAPSKSQKILYGLVTVGGRYLYTRINLWLLARSNPEDETPLSIRLSKILEHLSTIHSFATLFSFLLFLKNGHYRTILDRVLRLRLVAPNRSVAREVSFEYLNRQLVWHAFTEFLLFILPVMRIGRWRRWYNRFMRKARTLAMSATSGGSGDGEGSILKNTKGELGFLPEKTCAICFKETSADAQGGGGAGGSTDITNPYEAIPCGHLYCYICITSKITLEEGEGWECLRCSTLVKKCRPWKGGLWAEDGLTTSTSNDTGKKVGFEGDNGRTDAGDEAEEDDGIPTAVMGDDEDLAKLTETLVDDHDSHHHHRRPRGKSSSSVSGGEEEEDASSPSTVGRLGESYDNITIQHDNSDSERTERAASPVLHHWGLGSREHIVEHDDDDEEGDKVNNDEHSAHVGRKGGLEVTGNWGDHDSVYDTAGEDDEKLTRKAPY